MADWRWVYGRVATALGCLPSAIDEEPVVNIFELLDYWIEEPPTHVILALRYLGERKRQPVSEDQARDQLLAVQQMGPGFAQQSMPPELREMAQWADEQQDRLRGKGRQNGG
ncbi:MAG TPA: hypothetical protein VM554_12860 [Acidisarcina sp.]|nr:hypothetical protein [Acidisarcina sp.]